MSDPVISVRNLGKRYHLGTALRHDTLRDHIVDAVKSGWRRLVPGPSSVVAATSSTQSRTLNTEHRTPVVQCPSNQPAEGVSDVSTLHPPPSTGNDSAPPSPSSAFSSHPSALSAHPSALSSDEFWALKDVSFDVHPGDVVGVVGRNGAGKSTLLKILSQITEPTTGEVHIRGRVASLLEVGTGFHPELTGRENIFLNGAILGMRRAEIKSKFDEIVAFAEVEKFLDTPVKRYSSGMYVRLAFAVAAHLEPEILVVDEVLAVGDAEFQRKCLGKMQSVAASEGRTIIFVSHNLAAVQRLCAKGVFIQSGQVRFAGMIGDVLAAYQRSGQTAADDTRDLPKPGEARYVAWELAKTRTSDPHACYSRDDCEFLITLVSRVAIHDAVLGFAIWDMDGELVLAGNTSHGTEIPYFDVPEGTHQVRVKTRLPIKAGSYLVSVSFNSAIHGQLDYAYLEPKLQVLPYETALPAQWQGLISEPLTFGVEISP